MKKTITLLLIFSTNIFFSQVPNYVPTNGLVGWWPFNGNANDESGNGNNGVVNGATLIQDRTGNANSAYGLTTLTDNLTVDIVQPSINNNSLTVSLWMKFPSQFNQSTLALVKNGTPYSNGFWVAIDQNNSAYGVNNYLVMFLVGNGSSVTFISNQLELGLWSNIVSTYDGSNIKIFLNGVLKATQAYSLGLNSPDNNLIFGSWDNPTIPAVKTRDIDDIGIWNRALTEEEIIDLYNSSLSTQEFAINEVDIYPNPTSSILNFKSLVAVETIAIYNTLGQLVQQEKVNALEGSINIEKLAQGTYLVKVNDTAKGYTIIKN